jgi:transposase-like protein
MAEGQRMTVADVVEGVPAGEHGDYGREAVRLAAKQLMEAEISVETGATRGECRRSALPTGTAIAPGLGRRGSASWSCWFRASARARAYFPSSSSRCRRSEQAIAAVGPEACVDGVSTREVNRLIATELGSRGCRRVASAPSAGRSMRRSGRSRSAP